MQQASFIPYSTEREKKKKSLRYGEKLLLLSVDFPLSNTRQFFRPNREKKERKIIAAKKRMRGEREGWRGAEEEGRGIDLILRESHHSSVHFHSSGLVMGVLIWQVGGEGWRGI